MSTQKRSRACDACNRIKTKCDFDSADGSPPCQRCTRLNKECIITPPRRQKDRVAELESKVEALTRLLEAQGLSPLDSVDACDGSGDEAATTSTTNAFASKKRRIEDRSSEGRSERSGTGRSAEDARPTGVLYGSTTTLGLDRIMSVETQARILHKYNSEIFPHFPAVPVPMNTSLETLRSTKPWLLQAIIYAASTSLNLIPSEDRDKIAKLLMHDEAASTIAASPKSLELVQALQITCLWYWLPKHHKHIASFQLLDLATEIALSIGIGGPAAFSVPPLRAEGEDVEAAGTWRAWLMCYMLSAIMSTFTRQSNPPVWTQHHEQNLSMLEYSPKTITSDRLLAQYVRAEQLCQQIAAQLALNDLSIARDVSEPVMQANMQRLQNRIMDWQTAIPANLRIPSLIWWQYIATIYLHEPVLHTATNKQSFAAPFVAERLSVTDFPAPLVMPEHVTSYLALQNAIHALLDLLCAFETRVILALPAIYYLSRAWYAMYLLLKLYVVATAPGNTFGAIFSADDLLVEQYLQRMIAVAKRLKDADDRSAPVVILLSTTRMEEWLTNYKATIASSAPSGNTIQSSEPAQVRGFDPEGSSWDDFLLVPSNLPVGFEDYYSDLISMDAAQGTHLDETTG